MSWRHERRRVSAVYGGSWRPPPPNRALDRRQRVRRVRNWTRAFVLPQAIALAWERWTWPLAALFLLGRVRAHPSYGMTARRKLWLVWKMHRTTRMVFTGTTYRAHLLMAMKLLELDPAEKGVVVECGSFQGGSTANLSIICGIVGRELIVYDSFEGLPAPTVGDRVATEMGTGLYAGSLETVRRNVELCGRPDLCTFRKGWFNETLPHHEEPIVLAFVDVDYEASLHDCVLGIWPKLTDHGYFFIDEYVFNDYCALFWSERYWDRYFGRKPPGLIGSGSGVPLGGFYPGPWEDRTPLLTPKSTAYTRKDFSGHWTFYPPD